MRLSVAIVAGDRLVEIVTSITRLIDFNAQMLFRLGAALFTIVPTPLTDRTNIAEVALLTSCTNA
jgi:hypothetical protein